MMKYGLSDDVIGWIGTVFTRYPEISKVILYGSRAKGNYKEGSDIDLSLIGEGINLPLLHRIETELDDLLLPYKIDLNIYEKIKNEALRGHIERVGRVFYEKKSIGDKA